MKTSFSILPTSGNPANMHLLAEVNPYGISFLWYDRDPVSAKGALICSGSKGNNDLYEGVRSCLEANTIFKDDPRSVTIIYNFPEASLIPAKFYNPSSGTKLMDELFGKDSSGVLFTDGPFTIGEDRIHVVSRFPLQLKELFSEWFPGARYRSFLNVQPQPREEKHIRCVLFQDALIIMVYDGSKLLLSQFFNYNSPEEAAYHLLNSAALLGESNTSNPVYLSGMVDADSMLYNEIYKYFMDVRFETLDSSGAVEDIRAYPEHFFSYLTVMATCV